MKYIFLFVTVMSLTVFYTYNTDSSDSENQVVAYAYGNCWADWYYDYLDEEWEATYYRFAYAGVWAHSSNWGWWDAEAHVDAHDEVKPVTNYEFGVDDGVANTVPSNEYWGDNASYGRSRSAIVGTNINGTSKDKESWGSYYAIPMQDGGC